MKNNRPIVETKVKSKVKTTTKFTIIIGMISVLFVGVMLFNAAFLTTPVVSRSEAETMATNDVIAPYAKVTSPENLQGFEIGENIEIEVYAYDPEGGISGIKWVDIFINNDLQMRDKTRSWGLTWDTSTYQAGNYLIYARATDTAENQGELSNRVFITLK